MFFLFPHTYFRCFLIDKGPVWKTDYIFNIYADEKIFYTVFYEVSFAYNRPKQIQQLCIGLVIVQFCLT